MNDFRWWRIELTSGVEIENGSKNQPDVPNVAEINLIGMFWPDAMDKI